VNRQTPLATPVVPAPKLHPSQANNRLRPALVAPVSIVTPVGEFELLQGALVVGRLPECVVCLNDPLVSRMHLRIIVQGESVLVEDLHSANGVYLNGARVVSTAVLREGDRILIGTTELSLFELRDSSRSKLRAAPAVERSAPHHPPPRLAPDAPGARSARPGIALRLGASKAPDLPSMGPVGRKAALDFERLPTTVRASSLTMIGALADRLAATGEKDEAVYVLSGHLRRILQGANAGLAVPPDVATLASHYALLAARWSGQLLWTDYVVELHLSARLLMATSTLVEFEAASAHAQSYDRLLLAYYVEAMQALAPQFSAEERDRVELLACLAERT